jgi:YbbR domain-containing protein
VDRAEARIQLDPQGIDFDRDVELIAVDALGNELTQVEVEPTAVHVNVVILSDKQTRSLPVTPNVTGAPAPGFELATVAVQPLVVSVEGDADELAGLRSVTTAPISLNGATSNLSTTVALALPQGVLAVDAESVRVTITVRQATATRDFDAGIVLTGARSDRAYSLSTNRVLVTLGGSIDDLNRLDGRAFAVQAVVAGLEPGRHTVQLVANLPAGLALLAASPPQVVVTVTLPSASLAPSTAP